MKKRAILRVLGYARRYWLYLAGAVCGAVASVALTLLAPVIIGAGVDLILGPGQVDFQGLARIIGLLALVIGAVPVADGPVYQRRRLPHCAGFAGGYLLQAGAGAAEGDR